MIHWYKLGGPYGRTPEPLPPNAYCLYEAVLADADARRVAETLLEEGGCHVRVSTVFLALDHQHTPGGPPLLFETMIFGGEHDMWQDRYSTWVEAQEGHARAVLVAKGEWVEGYI